MKWNRKAIPYLILLAMAGLTIFLLSRQKQNETKKPETVRKERREPARPTDPNSPGNDRNRDAGSFVRQPVQLHYSKHARCRMGCRHIDAAEVKEMLQTGTINYQKSDMRAQPDPRYAIEGRTRDGQQVRIIVAQNPRSSTIVTVIDLDTDWDCHCPGDEHKKQR